MGRCIWPGGSEANVTSPSQRCQSVTLDGDGLARHQRWEINNFVLTIYERVIISAAVVLGLDFGIANGVGNCIDEEHGQIPHHGFCAARRLALGIIF